MADERISVLTEAQGLVHGDRNKSYGHPLHDYSRTAGMVNAMLGHKLKEPMSAEDLGLVMCCVKLSRQQNAPKRDNLVDLAGYAECVQWMIDERANPTAPLPPAEKSEWQKGLERRDAVLASRKKRLGPWWRGLFSI